ncbi:MAG TPA: protein kinase [Ktedonobacteraceae bacterium]|nr:protein kinase [Ktedonobacteraceae bacterium]
MQKHFHHYSLTERLASKPLRSVYLAHHVSDVSQEVVVKVFDSRCLNLEQESKNLLQKVEWIKQFTHAHIVPVLDLGIEQGQLYIVSSYQSSGSLRHRLDRLAPKRLHLQDALPIIFQVGRALRYAHQQNILHGNIKPENIFFNKLGEALLADFRLADLIDVTKLDYKSDPHSTCYTAPEQFSGMISEKSDQYGLACLAYELITGRTPFAVQGFSPMWTKQDTERAIPLSDLVPDLPEQAEEVVLKAMAKDPSERYANISIFIRALEALSLLPTALSTSVSTSPPMVALRSDTPVRSMAEPLETLATVGPAMRLSDAPVTTRLLERSEYVNNEHNTSKTLDTPPSETLHKRSSKILHTPSAKILDRSPSKASDTPSAKILDRSPSKASDTPSAKILDRSPSKTLDIPSDKILDRSPSKTLDIPSDKILDRSPSKALATLTEEAQVESLTKGGLPQSRKPLTPTLWVAFALSGLVILMGAILPYLLVPFHSPGSSNAGKSSPKPPITNPSTRITPTTAPIQSQSPSFTLIQTHLTSSYAEQTSNVYNLTNEGTLDWIQWGLNAPEDVNHKLAVQQQISSFTLIGNGVVQRDNHYANAYTWSDGTPVMVAPPQQPSGVYVRGIGNGFTFTVVASTTPRTLRVYLGAAHAEGHFWAGINGRAITDTTLDMRNNPNIADNGIYTVTFSSSVPDQLVMVKYTVRASDVSNGYVMLEAATLED